MAQEDNTNEVKQYRIDKSLKLFEGYKDLIKKTFEVVDKDLLQNRIDGEDEKETEQKYLDAIKKRRVSLDEVDIMLDKIEKLERILSANNETVEEKVSTNPAKRFAQK